MIDLRVEAFFFCLSLSVPLQHSKDWEKEALSL